MAVTDRAFSTIPLYRMEYRHTSQPFPQRINTPGTVDASALGAAVSEFSQRHSLPMAGGLNSSGSSYLHNQFTTSHCQVGENGGLFLGGGAQSPAVLPALSQIPCTVHPGRPRKHQLHEGNDDCPSKKRRVSASSTALVFPQSPAPGIFAGGSGRPFWASSHSPVKEASILPALTDQSAAMIHPVSTEEMEEVAVESQCDAALRRIRDIESRLIVEDDEEEDDDNNSRDSHLPTLVMSDVLVEGFKKGLDESLTKKIVDSINRPSMELVLWKPQPEYLVNKLQSIASSYKTDDKEAAEKIPRTPPVPLLQEVTPSDADKSCVSNPDCHLDMMWNREEEEMEL
ncbi:coiled-coil domain-containing protein 117 [Dendropsophus ebraccatus]|uniref:coiled-coil domain-containing protein 117 n=1 Tax=Dendropsophus ebraccatus TaxID=150705 RepID=UPI003831131C